MEFIIIGKYLLAQRTVSDIQAMVWGKDDKMTTIMQTCVIIHNMLAEESSPATNVLELAV